MNEIETGVPIPSRRMQPTLDDGLGRGEDIETIRSMKIGDSIIRKNANKAQTTMRRFGFKPSQKQLPDGMYRIWRVL